MKRAKPEGDVVACTLGASELRQRETELRARLLGLVTAVGETDDGYVFDFVPGSTDEVREFVALESDCCGFMQFEVEERDGRTRLRVSGPGGTKEFVRRVWLADPETG